MTALRHPAAGCTRRQIEVFEQIAIGNDDGHSPRTIKALLDKGLIVELAPKVVGQDVFGLITVPQYQVPIHLHAQWCDWCAEQPGEEP